MVGEEDEVKAVNPNDDANAVTPSRTPTKLRFRSARPMSNASWTKTGRSRRTRPATVRIERPAWEGKPAKYEQEKCDRLDQAAPQVVEDLPA